MKNWIVAVIGVAVLGVILFLSDRPAQTPSGLDVIRTSSQYMEANNKAATLALAVFQKAEQGTPLTEDDKSKLREAIKQFEAMQIYEPRHIASYFGAGKCYMLLGEKEKAGEKFGQAILNKELDPEKDTQIVRLTTFEAMGLLSEITLDLAAEEIANANSAEQANDKVGADAARKRSQLYYEQALKYANGAVEGVPTGIRYLIDRANVYLALGKKAEAKADVQKARELDPTNPRVLQTAKLVGF